LRKARAALTKEQLEARRIFANTARQTLHDFILSMGIFAALLASFLFIGATQTWHYPAIRSGLGQLALTFTVGSLGLFMIYWLFTISELCTHIPGLRITGKIMYIVTTLSFPVAVVLFFVWYLPKSDAETVRMCLRKSAPICTSTVERPSAKFKLPPTERKPFGH
jgi:hypothetical protein